MCTSSPQGVTFRRCSTSRRCTSFASRSGTTRMPTRAQAEVTGSLVLGVLLIAGFVPVLGQTVVPVLLAFVTAWFLALELVAVSCYRRGIGLRERRTLLARRRGLAFGLGLPASLLCVIPFAAILVLPVAFVGGVLGTVLVGNLIFGVLFAGVAAVIPFIALGIGAKRRTSGEFGATG